MKIPKRQLSFSCRVPRQLLRWQEDPGAWLWSWRRRAGGRRPANPHSVALLDSTALVPYSYQCYTLELTPPLSIQALHQYGAEVVLTDRQVQMPLLRRNVEANFGKYF